MTTMNAADFNETDLIEAFDIATHASAIPIERRHLVALMRAWDEALDLFRIVLHRDADGHAEGSVRTDAIHALGRITDARKDRPTS